MTATSEALISSEIVLEVASQRGQAKPWPVNAKQALAKIDASENDIFKNIVKIWNSYLHDQRSLRVFLAYPNSTLKSILTLASNLYSLTPRSRDFLSLGEQRHGSCAIWVGPAESSYPKSIFFLVGNRQVIDVTFEANGIGLKTRLIWRV
jgi:hypothetical protein